MFAIKYFVIKADSLHPEIPDLTTKNTRDLRPEIGRSRFPGHSVIKIDCKTVVFLPYSTVAKRRKRIPRAKLPSFTRPGVWAGVKTTVVLFSVSLQPFLPFLHSLRTRRSNTARVARVCKKFDCFPVFHQDHPLHNNARLFWGVYYSLQFNLRSKEQATTIPFRWLSCSPYYVEQVIKIPSILTILLSCFYVAVRVAFVWFSHEPFIGLELRVLWNLFGDFITCHYATQ